MALALLRLFCCHAHNFRAVIHCGDSEVVVRVIARQKELSPDAEISVINLQQHHHELLTNLCHLEASLEARIPQL